MQFFPVAQCLGYVAFIFGIAAFLQKDDRRLKKLIAVECLAYAVHFWMLHALSASFATLVSCARSLLSLKTRSRLVAGAIIAINLGFGLWSAKTVIAWLPILSSCMATYAFFEMKGLPMRAVLFACTLMWLVNNIAAGSIGGTLLETLIAIANASTMIRLLGAKTPKTASAAPAILQSSES